MRIDEHEGKLDWIAKIIQSDDRHLIATTADGEVFMTYNEAGAAHPKDADGEPTMFICGANKDGLILRFYPDPSNPQIEARQLQSFLEWDKLHPSLPMMTLTLSKDEVDKYLAALKAEHAKQP